MNATELYHKSGDEFKPSSVFYCSKCRHVHQNSTSAEKCCQPNKCSCGAECKPYWLKCDECIAKDRAEKDRKTIEAAEKLEEWDGPVFSDSYPFNEGFAFDLSEMQDYFADGDEDIPTAPEFVFCCDTHPIKLDVRDILERETEEWPEGLSDSLIGEDELQTALNAFCEKNKGVASWEPNYKKMVRLNAKQITSQTAE